MENGQENYSQARLSTQKAVSGRERWLFSTNCQFVGDGRRGGAELGDRASEEGGAALTEEKEVRLDLPPAFLHMTFLLRSWGSE